MAIVFATVAIRPLAASKAVIVLLGLIPAVTAVLVYLFIGNFIGGHIFLAARHRRNLGRIFVAGGDETVKPQFPPRAFRRNRVFVISLRLAGCVNFKLA
jgi:hypothetical protein